MNNEELVDLLQFNIAADVPTRELVDVVLDEAADRAADAFSAEVDWLHWSPTMSVRRLIKRAVRGD